jgi:autotransporter-associated beta strand protein
MTTHPSRLRRFTRRAAATSLLLPLAVPTSVRAIAYWDPDASAANNNTSTGAGLGGSGTWSSAVNWFNGTSEIAWVSGGDAVFTGTAGTVTLASPQSAASLTFKSNGYALSGSTLTAVAPATYSVDAGVTATIASTIAGSATMTKTGPGTLVLSNTANVNTADATAGGWRIDGGTLRLSADQSLGAPLPDAARNTVTDIQLNQSTIQFGASMTVDINRRTKVNTNSATQNLGDAVIDVNEHDVNWFGSIQGGLGSIRVTGSNGNGGKLVLGTDKISSINPFGSALPGGTVNLTVEEHVVVQTAGTVTPSNGELGSETGAAGAVLAIKLQTGGQIRSESGGYTFLRNLILGPGGGSLDTGAWIQTFSGGTISGPGSLTKFGGSTLVLDNPSATWAGGTTVAGGTLQLGVGGSNGLLPGVLGTPSSVVVNAGATLKFLRGSNKSFFDNISGEGGVVIANVNNTTVRLVSDNTYTGGTTITSGTLMIGQGNPNQPGSIVGNVANNAALIFNKVEDLSYAGSISGSGTVTKQSPGKLSLTGASTYIGGTTVSAGTLLANNSTGSATGTGPVGVSSSATLGGTGSIDGVVTINAGAHLAPGASPGTLTVGSLALAANSVLDYEFGSPGSSDKTVITTAGGLTVNGGTLNITGLSGFGAGTYPLLDYTTSFTGSTSNLTIGSAPSGFVYTLVNQPGTTSIDLVVAVPEPAGLVGFGALTCLLRRDRRRDSAGLLQRR